MNKKQKKIFEEMYKSDYDKKKEELKNILYFYEDFIIGIYIIIIIFEMVILILLNIMIYPYIDHIPYLSPSFAFSTIYLFFQDLLQKIKSLIKLKMGI